MNTNRTTAPHHIKQNTPSCSHTHSYTCLHCHQSSFSIWAVVFYVSLPLRRFTLSCCFWKVVGTSGRMIFVWRFKSNKSYVAWMCNASKHFFCLYIGVYRCAGMESQASSSFALTLRCFDLGEGSVNNRFHFRTRKYFTAIIKASIEFRGSSFRCTAKYHFKSCQNCDINNEK